MKARLEIDGVIVDCWSPLILVSQGCCLGMHTFQSLSHSWSGPNLATRMLFSIFLSFVSPFFYLFSLFPLWTHPIDRFLSFLSFCPSPQTDVTQKAVGWKEQQEKGRVQPDGVKGESAAG